MCLCLGCLNGYSYNICTSVSSSICVVVMMMMQQLSPLRAISVFFLSLFFFFFFSFDLTIFVTVLYTIVLVSSESQIMARGKKYWLWDKQSDTQLQSAREREWIFQVELYPRTPEISIDKYACCFCTPDWLKHQISKFLAFFLLFFSNICASLLHFCVLCGCMFASKYPCLFLSIFYDIYIQELCDGDDGGGGAAAVARLILVYSVYSLSRYVLFSFIYICSKCECLRCWNRTWTIHVHITILCRREYVHHIESRCSPLLLLLFALIWLLYELFSQRYVSIGERLAARACSAERLCFAQHINTHHTYSFSLSLSWSLSLSFTHARTHSDLEEKEAEREQQIQIQNLNLNTKISAKCDKEYGRYRYMYICMWKSMAVFMANSYTLLTHWYFCWL